MWTGIIGLATLACGIDVGWQPLREGGMVYMIQIEPYMLDTLKAGEAIESDVRPDVKDIRSFRITVGNKALPHDLPAPAAGSASAPSAGLSAPALGSAAPSLGAPSRGAGSPASAAASPATASGPALSSPATTPAAPGSLGPADARSAPRLPQSWSLDPLPLPKGATDSRSPDKPLDSKPADRPIDKPLGQPVENPFGKPADRSPTSSQAPSYRESNRLFGSNPPTAPGALPPNPAGQRLAAQSAVYEQPGMSLSPATANPAPGAATAPAVNLSKPAEETPARPWFLFSLVSVALAGSLGWNGYLLWALQESRQRYRAMLEHYRQRLKDADVADVPAAHFEPAESAGDDDRDDDRAAQHSSHSSSADPTMRKKRR